MDEPVKENPKAPKRSRRKPAMEPLGWDEIISQPGMGGYLSFLNGPVPLPHLQPPVPGVPAVARGVSSEPPPEALPPPEVVSSPHPGLGQDSGVDSNSNSAVET